MCLPNAEFIPRLCLALKLVSWFQQQQTQNAEEKSRERRDKANTAGTERADGKHDGQHGQTDVGSSRMIEREETKDRTLE